MEISNQSSDYYNTTVIVGLILLISWLFLPLVVWISLLGISCYFLNFGRLTGFFSFLVISSLAFLISSRYVGYLWGGSDDMPSYFLAYLNYDEFKWVISSSVKYARHADFAFSYYSWFIAWITKHHLFLYYFLTVFFTYAATYKFLKITKVPNIILSFLFVAIFFKYFQFQWHLIRSVLAVPIILSGLLLVPQHKIKGIGVFILGGLTHFSTFALSLPLLLQNERLNRKYNLLNFLTLFFIMVTGVVILLISAKFLAAFSNYYIVSKIVSRLVIEPSFLMAPFLFFFVGILALTYPVYRITKEDTYIRLFNISFYYCVIGLIAMFIAGKELYRFIMPLFLIYSPLIFKSVIYFKQKLLIDLAFLSLFFIHVASFLYVVNLNESQFFYLTGEEEPVLSNGGQMINSFIQYVNDDIDFYSGYRQ